MLSNICDISLFLVFGGLPHVLSFIYELLINILANFSKNHKITHLNMRSKTERSIFACYHSTKQSPVRLHRTRLERRGGGGGGKIEIRTDIFKMISRHEMVDTNWSPTENINRIFAKIHHPNFARNCCCQQPDTNESAELTEVSIMAFNSSIGINYNDFIEDKFRQEKEKYREVSHDTDAFFGHPVKFFCISLKSY